MTHFLRSPPPPSNLDHEASKNIFITHLQFSIYYSMSDVNKQSALAEAFVSGILNALQDFWFSHLADQTHVIVPSIQDINVWFVDKSDEYDDLCRYVLIARITTRTLVWHCS
jgi:hypothetical protein